VHRDFADWYRIADLEPKVEMLEKRWQGIEEFVESLDATNTIELVRIFHKRSVRDRQFIADYRNTFKAIDSTFPMRDNDLELRVLAGSSIVCLLEIGPSNFADAAALGMVCSDCRGLLNETLLPEMVALARAYLFSRSEHLRARGEVPAITVPDLNLENLLEAFRQTCATDGLPNLPEPVVALIEALASAINHHSTSVEKAMSRLSERQRLLQEESDILWWLFGGHSRDLKQPMAALGLPATCLVAAKELADLTTILPGPLPAPAFLGKMIHAATRKLPSSMTIQEAVNASPREWRNQWFRKDDMEHIADLCPILLAILKSLETDGPDD
jgi:hypothetical protein